MVTHIWGLAGARVKCIKWTINSFRTLSIFTRKMRTHVPIELKLGTYKGLIKAYLHNQFGYNPIKIYRVMPVDIDQRPCVCDQLCVILCVLERHATQALHLLPWFSGTQTVRHTIQTLHLLWFKSLLDNHLFDFRFTFVWFLIVYYLLLCADPVYRLCLYQYFNHNHNHWNCNKQCL